MCGCLAKWIRKNITGNSMGLVHLKFGDYIKSTGLKKEISVLLPEKLNSYLMVE